MSAKPTVLPKWAATATFPTPSSGKQNAGWKTGERPPAGYLNWLAWNTYLWLKWLDDGNVSFADVQTATLEASGNATVSGTLGVTGALTASGTLGVGGGLTASSGIVVPTGQTIELQGDAHVKHGTRTKSFAGALGHVSSSAVSNVTTSGVAIFYSATGAVDTISIPITLEVGKRITAVRCYANDDGSGHIVSAQLKVTNMATDSTSNQSNAVSTSNAGALQTLNLTNLGGGAGFVDVAAGFGYAVQFSVSGTTTGRHINGVEVDYTRPN